MKFRAGFKGFSPWFILGVVAIIIPVIAVGTLDNIKKQRSGLTEVLLAQGAALIRSFEGSARAAAGLNWGAFELQKLLVEMAQQPDLDYLLVVNSKGLILADSDPAMVGETYGGDLDLAGISRSAEVSFRIVTQTSGQETFEVFRRFSPGEKGRDNPLAAGEEGQVIFVGMNFEPIKKAREKEIAQTLTLTAVLVGIGVIGLILFMLTQAYRTARVSLSQAKAFAAVLIEHLPLGLLAFDREGNLATANREAARILQGDPAGRGGDTAGSLLPEGLANFLTAAQAASAPQDAVITLREPFNLTLETISAPLQDEGGLRGNILLFRDITELERLRDEVARSRRLVSLGNLAAGVAHEIRNPLSSIKGFATYFRERLADSPPDVETAEVMIREVDRLNRVINELLEFARPRPPGMRSLNVSEVIGQAKEMMASLAKKKGIALNFQLPQEDLIIEGDPDQLKQVIWNLYLNALEATEPAGRIEVILKAENDRIGITVADTGKGISGQDLPHLFDPYFTTKAAGVGLGLAIVHRIVEAHRGEIRAENRPEGGASFKVLLPKVDRY